MLRAITIFADKIQKKYYTNIIIYYNDNISDKVMHYARRLPTSELASL